MELGTQAAAIGKLGYGVAALSYDQPGALAHFAQRKQIQYPLLSDPASKIIDAFGIRNETAKDGFAKGIPHPGLFLIGATGRVEAKYFEEDYRERITIDLRVRSGKPCIRGTRITVADVFDYLGGGMTISEVLGDFSDLTAADIQACFAFAADGTAA